MEVGLQKNAHYFTNNFPMLAYTNSSNYCGQFFLPQQFVIIIQLMRMGKAPLPASKSNNVFGVLIILLLKIHLILFTSAANQLMHLSRTPENLSDNFPH